MLWRIGLSINQFAENHKAAMLAMLLHCGCGVTRSASMHACMYELRHKSFAVLPESTAGMHDHAIVCKLQACKAEAYHLQA